MIHQQPEQSAMATLLPFPNAPTAAAAGEVDRRQAGDVERAGPVLEGEIVEETPNLPALPTVLPAWMANRATATATVRWAGRYASRHAGFHAVLTPLYGLRMAYWVGRGLVIGAGRGAGWLLASAYAPMIADATKAADWDTVRGLMAEHRRLIQRRLQLTGGGALVAAVGLTVGTLTLGGWIDWLIGAGLVVGAGALGKPERAQLVADAAHPGRPQRGDADRGPARCRTGQASMSCRNTSRRWRRTIASG
jgi:DNA segregation ATPase FtsK/SpoIIIE, S-DNA-T family